MQTKAIKCKNKNINAKTNKTMLLKHAIIFFIFFNFILKNKKLNFINL